MIDLSTLLSRASRAAYLDPINGRQISEQLDALARDLEVLQKKVMEWRQEEDRPMRRSEDMADAKRELRLATDNFFDQYRLRM